MFVVALRCESHMTVQPVDLERVRSNLRTALIQVEAAIAAKTEEKRNRIVRRLLHTVLKCVRGRTASKLGEALIDSAIIEDEEPAVHSYENGHRLYLRGVFDVEELSRRIVW